MLQFNHNWRLSRIRAGQKIGQLEKFYSKLHLHLQSYPCYCYANQADTGVRTLHEANLQNIFKSIMYPEKQAPMASGVGQEC